MHLSTAEASPTGIGSKEGITYSLAAQIRGNLQDDVTRLRYSSSLN